VCDSAIKTFLMILTAKDFENRLISGEVIRRTKRCHFGPPCIGYNINMDSVIVTGIPWQQQQQQRY